MPRAVVIDTSWLVDESHTRGSRLALRVRGGGPDVQIEAFLGHFDGRAQHSLMSREGGGVAVCGRDITQEMADMLEARSELHAQRSGVPGLRRWGVVVERVNHMCTPCECAIRLERAP